MTKPAGCGKCGQAHKGCTGHRKTDGRACGQAAGRGTDHPGYGACKLHGGCTPGGAKHGRELQVIEEGRKLLARLDASPVTDPLSALARLAGEVAAWREAMAAKVNELTELRYSGAKTGEQLRAEVELYERAMDRLERILVAMARLNIDERLARIQEQQAAAVVAAVEAWRKECGDSREKIAEAKRGIGRHLRVAG